MKHSTLFFLVAVVLGCTSNSDKQKVIEKSWLNRSVAFDRIQTAIHTYHMFDSTDTKVGSMIFGWYFENGRLIARDTSQFDNGSIYETAEFSIDTGDFTLRTAMIDMTAGNARLNVDLEKNDGVVQGTYQVKQDTLIVNRVELDSAIAHDIFRSELYMLLHTLNYQPGDSINFSAIVPMSMAVSEASITYDGEETITVPAGSFDCDVIWLKTDGKMPHNKIWIRKEEPRKIVKFYIPGSELDIELISTREVN